MANPTITRDQLIDHLNEDLAREYQAIIAYVVYSQALKGAQFASASRLASTGSPRTFARFFVRNRSIR